MHCQGVLLDKCDFGQDKTRYQDWKAIHQALGRIFSWHSEGEEFESPSILSWCWSTSSPQKWDVFQESVLSGFMGWWEAYSSFKINGMKLSSFFPQEDRILEWDKIEDKAKVVE